MVGMACWGPHVKRLELFVDKRYINALFNFLFKGKKYEIRESKEDEAKIKKERNRRKSKRDRRI